MMFRTLLLVLLVCVLPIGCSADAHTDGTRAAGTALSAPGLTPIPCDETGYRWNGTRVQLLLADALAGCAAFEDSWKTDTFPLADAALRDTAAKMASVLPETEGNLTGYWRVERAKPEKNCDQNNIDQPASVQIKETPVRETLNLTGAFLDRPWVVDLADMDLRWAGLNLCMAMRLRELSPGTAGAEALLMSAAEQRELLETIRERVQIAMVHYALLGSVFASEGAGSQPPVIQICHCTDDDPVCECDALWWLDPNDRRKHNRIPYLQWFGRNAPTSWLTDMGRDFATAVQLHVTVTNELESLFARSRSAMLPRGGDAEGQSEERWGPGSWQQRLLASAYGGDPLAADTKSPWKHPTALAGPANGKEWPTRAEMPFVGTEAQEPQIHKAFALLKSHDILDIGLAAGTSTCRKLDADLLAGATYQLLELKTREALCADFNPATQSCGPVALPSDETKYAVFTYYGVRKEHVQKALRIVADFLGPEIDIATGGSCTTKRFGSHDWKGALTVAGGNHVHVSAETAFVSRELSELGGLFSRYASARFPGADRIDPIAPSFQQGFGADADIINLGLQGGIPLVLPIPRYAAEQQRTMGSVRALSLTRDLVASALVRLRGLGAGAPGKARLDDYFKHADSMMGVASGAVGDGFRAEPVPAMLPDSFLQSVYEATPGRPAWTFSVTAASDDPFWTTSSGDGKYHVLLGVPNDGWAANLARHTEAKAFGRGIGHVVLSALGGGHWCLLVPSAVELTGLRRLASTPMELSTAESWTLLAWKVTQAEFMEVAYPPASPIFKGEVRVLAASLELATRDVAKAEYFAGGGALGAWLARQVQPDAKEPTEPAFDGLGFPRAWVPPANSQVLGGSAGVPAFRYYLDAAGSSSKEAAGAVETALEGLLEQTEDEAKFNQLETKKQIETTRSLESQKESAQKLCGHDNPKCDVKNTKKMKLKKEWYPALTGFTPPTLAECNAAYQAQSSDDPSDAAAKAELLLRCLAGAAVETLLATEVEIAAAVEPTLTSSVVPTFSEFAGGEIQSAFVEQWRAIKAPDERFSLMFKQIDASVAAMKTAAAVVYKAKLVKAHSCGFDDQVRAIVGGAVQGSALGPVGTVLGAWDSDNQHLEKCMELGVDVGIAISKQMETVKQSLVNVSSTLTGLVSDRAVIVQSGVTVQQLVNQSQLEVESYQLELDLFKKDIQALQQSELKTSFGLYRRYRSYDAWRAKALLDNSRRYALAARRAIEASYVVDLSRITQDEAFVASPASWANEVYEYDLSLPAAVGLTVGSETPDGIYPNKVNDYVVNLNGFVDGFAVTRPSAAGNEDVEVIHLKGLAAGQELVYEDGDPTTAPIVTHPDLGVWQVHCPPAGQVGAEWSAVPPVTAGGVRAACIDFVACGCPPGDMACVDAATCAKPVPDAARIVFSLDPWGRLDSGFVSEPFDARYNARWSRLAVNLVGTGIRDCKAASDPLTCYSEGFIRFDLRHVGRAWITDFSGQWRALDLPPGRIESGKALAAELWLDPLKDGWESSYIQPVARTELYWRPLAGAYVLELEAGPDVRLDRLERVQLLMGTSYWVKQQ